MTNRSVIVFSPHPDDETLGCGGTIAKKLSEGYEVTIVELTDGKYGLSCLGIVTDYTPEEIKEMRKHETLDAAKILGVHEQNLIFLDFEDTSLILNEISLETKIVSILRQKKPSEVFFPFSKDVNPDHQIANRSVRNAVSNFGEPVAMYEYSINQPHHRIKLIFDSFTNLFTNKMLTIDVSSFLELKKAALGAFRSQITRVSHQQTEPALSAYLLKIHLKKHELFYRV